jgi:hypothetical protein
VPIGRVPSLFRFAAKGMGESSETAPLYRELAEQLSRQAGLAETQAPLRVGVASAWRVANAATPSVRVLFEEIGVNLAVEATSSALTATLSTEVFRCARIAGATEDRICASLFPDATVPEGASP